MKPGTLVVVLPGFEDNVPPRVRERIKWLPIADEKTIYTIKEFEPNALKPDSTIDAGVNFEEGVIGYNPYGDELMIGACFVREVMGPGEINAQDIVEDAIETVKPCLVD